MREIKFRAWDETVLRGMTNWSDIIKIGFELFIKENFGYILMQYTGLKDKNGKEIYEGDLLRVTEYDEKNPLVVGWEERTASFSINKKGWAFTHWFGESVEPEDCEIIGNIYENKELLEG